MNEILRYAKAIFGALATVAVSFLTALLPYIESGNALTAESWVVATIAALVAGGTVGGIVFATPNKQTPKDIRNAIALVEHETARIEATLKPQTRAELRQAREDGE